MLFVSRTFGMAFVLALFASPAVAQEAYRHKGSLGLLLAAGPGARSSSALGNSGFLGLVEAGATAGFFEHQELLAIARLSLREKLGLGALAGVRSVYGLDRWKTFFDLTVSAELIPVVFVGPRGAVGVQYDLGNFVGVYAALGVGIGFGNGLFIQGELTVGFQFRSYLLE